MACASLLGLGVPAAHAELIYSTAIGSEGSGDGQFLSPQGIGVDQTTLGPTSGDVYVADTGNARVEQFDSSGNFIRTWGWGVSDGASSFEVCTSGCRAGVAGAGAGQLSAAASSVAVDSSSGPSQGDIYVGDSGNHVVDKFSPSGLLLATITGPSAGTSFTAIGGVAIDANGNLWVAERNAEVFEFDSAGTLLGQFNDNYGETLAIAVDTADEVYLIRGAGETEKWNAAARTSGSGQAVADTRTGTGLAVDLATNDLYVDLGASVDQWDSTGKSLGNFGTGSLTRGAQLAYNPNPVLPGAGGPGALYVADQTGNQVVVFVPPPPAAPVVQPNSENATSVTAKAATLEAKVNANGLDTHVYFEYGVTTAYGSTAPAPPGADLGSNFGSVNATASISGLSASTTYHFRVVATNALGTTEGPDATFTTGTPAAPTVNSEGVGGIGATKATLEAAINPQLADTHYFFEYGTTAAYEAQVPLPPGRDIGESGAQSVFYNLTGLQPQTTYHFRVVATNSIGTTDGQDGTFTTEPPIKIDAVSVTGVTETAAQLSAKINTEDILAQYHFEYGPTPSYGNQIPVPDGTLGAAEGDQGVAVQVTGLQPGTRYYFRLVVTDSFTTKAGSAQSFTTFATGEATGLPDDRAYELVSPTEKNGGDVGGNAVNGLIQALPSAWGRAAPDGSAMAYASLTSFGNAQSASILSQYLSLRGPTGWTTQSLLPPIEKAPPQTIRPGYRLYTPDLSAGILNWGSAPLTPGAPEGKERENLYLHRFNEAPYELLTNVAPGKSYETLQAGATADLRHVVFDASAALLPGASQSGNNVYEWYAGSLRLVSVLPGSAGAAQNAGAGNGEFETFMQENVISSDGSRVFWSSSQQLYVREDGTTTLKLNESQRTPSLGDGSADYRGATLDGSKVFFTDSTQLTNAEDDHGGLYEYDFRNGKLTDLSPDNSGSQPEVEGVLGVSKDGSSVYFMARAALAGAATAGRDNLYLSRDGIIRFIGALSSEDSGDWSQYPETRKALVTPDGEYLAFVSEAPLTGYDNTDAVSGSPDAEVFVYHAGDERLVCASCNPSGGQPVGPASEPNAEHTGHTPRFITEDGRRVFFSSKDTLLPSDTNGQENVYEYEDGAIRMISSGTSNDVSVFSDASANGDDVFFTTRAQLVPQDVDNSADMYDARVDGGFPAPSAPPSCTGEYCRGPLSESPASPSIGSEERNLPPETPPAQQAEAPKPSKKAHKSKKKSRRKRKAKGKKAARKPTRRTLARHRKASARPRRHRGRNS